VPWHPSSGASSHGTFRPPLPKQPCSAQDFSSPPPKEAGPAPRETTAFQPIQALQMGPWGMQSNMGWMYDSRTGSPKTVPLHYPLPGQQFTNAGMYGPNFFTSAGLWGPSAGSHANYMPFPYQTGMQVGQEPMFHSGASMQPPNPPMAGESWSVPFGPMHQHDPHGLNQLITALGSQKRPEEGPTGTGKSEASVPLTAAALATSGAATSTDTAAQAQVRDRRLSGSGTRPRPSVSGNSDGREEIDRGTDGEAAEPALKTLRRACRDPSPILGEDNGLEQFGPVAKKVSHPNTFVYVNVKYEKIASTRVSYANRNSRKHPHSKNDGAAQNGRTHQQATKPATVRGRRVQLRRQRN
jgi:hypothetical protein